MSQVEPEGASRQLAEIQARQSAAIRHVLVPRWYWWVLAGAMIALGLVVDTQPQRVVVPAALLFAFGVAVLSVWAIAGGLTGVRARSALVGPEGAGAIVVTDFVVVGAALAIAFSLRAVHFPLPATAGVAAGAVVLVLGGPMLMSWLEARMRARAAR